MRTAAKVPLLCAVPPIRDMNKIDAEFFGIEKFSGISFLYNVVEVIYEVVIIVLLSLLCEIFLLIHILDTQKPN